MRLNKKQADGRISFHSQMKHVDRFKYLNLWRSMRCITAVTFDRLKLRLKKESMDLRVEGQIFQFFQLIVFKISLKNIII